ncbi:hypothetical protein AAG570_005827 [Ranatra chinensis]|uniref:Uncharacterized protein n=1 Tax=Ranatra chinensis TaxID=642074 RepID=A0ABD0XYK5_9HEMI
MAELSVYIPWLCLVTKHWSGRLKSSAVRCFVMQLAGLVATSPTGFFALYESEILKSLCSFVSTDDCKGDFSVLHGYAKMMMDISTHQSGIHWIIEAGNVRQDSWANMYFVEFISKKQA